MHDKARRWMFSGAAAALCPFLNVLNDSSGGVPWGPSDEHWTALADQYLLQCGYLAGLQRLVALERYGLSRATFLSDDHLVVEAASDVLERSDVKAQGQLSLSRLDMDLYAATLPIDIERALQRIDERSGLDMGGWFIRYDGDEEVMQRSRERVIAMQHLWPEAEALPDLASIGGRSFQQWKNYCGMSAARVLHHIEFATRLRAKHQGLELRNLLTLFARREDVFAVWGADDVDKV